MSTPSLGELLRTTIDRNAAEAERKRLEKIEQERAERERDERLVRSLFDDAKHVFTSAILAGKEIVPIRVGNGQNTAVSHLTNGYSNEVNKSSNAYFFIWKDFSDWADSQGLDAHWTYADDGFGKDDWRLLSVTPKAPV